MSVELWNLAWKVPVTPPQKLVLLALADHANDAGICWPSVTRLKQRTGLGQRTIYRALDALEKAGHIRRTTDSGRGAEYEVHPCQSGSSASATPVPKRQRTRATAAPRQCHSDTAPVPQRHIEPSGTISELTENNQPTDSIALGIREEADTPELPVVSIEVADPTGRRKESTGNNLAMDFLTSVVEVFHEALPELPRVTSLTLRQARQLEALVKARVAGGAEANGLQYWRCFFAKVGESDFLCGRGPRGWHGCTFDWLIGEENFQKVVEDRYANSQPAMRGIRAFD